MESLVLDTIPLDGMNMMHTEEGFIAENLSKACESHVDGHDVPAVEPPCNCDCISSQSTTTNVPHASSCDRHAPQKHS